MRISAIFATVAVLTAVPAQAQTFAGSGAVCLQKWYWGGSSSYDCSYASMAQCTALTVGLPAMCTPNPYAASAQVPRGRAYRQPRGGY